MIVQVAVRCAHIPLGVSHDFENRILVAIFGGGSAELKFVGVGGTAAAQGVETVCGPRRRPVRHQAAGQQPWWPATRHQFCRVPLTVAGA